MHKNMELDWFNVIKQETVTLTFFLKFIKEELVSLLVTNKWISEDYNLGESLIKLTEMILISEKDLDVFMHELQRLDNNHVTFEVEDIKAMFDYIKENIHLESGYLKNMIEYMPIVDDTTLDYETVKEKFDNYLECDIACFNQMKINNNELKKIKRERSN